MTWVVPGEVISRRMDAKTLDAMGMAINEHIDDLEREYAPLFRAMAVWWTWYEAEPREKEKNYPWRKASNVVVPLIGSTCDALVARSAAQVTAAAPVYWTVKSQNEDAERKALTRNIATLVNWRANGNSYSMKSFTLDLFLDLYVLGRSVAAIDWRSDVKHLFFGRAGAAVQRAPVEMMRGPVVSHVPREHILWDTRSSINQAPIVVRQHEWTWRELRAMAQLDDAWDMQAVEDIKAHPGDAGGPAMRVQKVKDELALRDRDGLDGECHDVRKVHIDMSMLGNRFEVEGQETKNSVDLPMLAHVHRKTGKILRLVAEPYHIHGKPYEDVKFRGKTDAGVAKRLEQLQSMMTTDVNQSFDARTRSIALWAKTRDAKHLRTPIDLSHPLLVSAMDEFEPLNIGSPLQTNLMMSTAAQVMAERWMGTNDPLLGRETRSGGHPAPATSTLALLEQSGVMSAGTDILIQECLSRVGEHVAVLEQQFEDNSDGFLQQVFGAVDAQSIGSYLFPDEPIPGNYLFDVTALSRSENPDAQMTRAVKIFQAHQQYWAFAIQGAQVLDMPPDRVGPKMKATYAKAMDSMNRIYEMVLDAANVDEMERYLGELDAIGVDARNAFQQFAREQQQAAQPDPGGNGGDLSALLGAGVGGVSGGGANGSGTPGLGGGQLQ